MAKKIEIINSALVITDTVTSTVIFDAPKKEVYYVLDKLLNEAIIQFRASAYSNIIVSLPDSVPLADAIDGADAPYTEASWLTFARTNLGSS